jgi:hypothetical protein
VVTSGRGIQDRKRRELSSKIEDAIDLAENIEI